MTVPYMGNRQTFSINGTDMMGFCSVGKHGTHLEREGTRGVRSRNSVDVVEGPYAVSGQLILNPTSADLDVLEAFIIGAESPAGTFLVDETLGDFPIVIDRGNDVYTYTGCKIVRASYSGLQGGLLRLVCDIVGKTAAATGDRPSAPEDTPVFTFASSVFTLAAAAREVEEFEMVIDHHMITDRFQNALTVTDIPEGDRTVSLRTVHSWSTNSSPLFGQAIGGAAGSLAITDASSNTRTYSFGRLQVPTESPPLIDRGAMKLICNHISRQFGFVAGTTEDIQCVVT